MSSAPFHGHGLGPDGGPGPRRFTYRDRGRDRPRSRLRGLLQTAFLTLLPAAFLAAAALELSGCNKREATGDPRIAKGKVLYSFRCGSCHNVNPAKDGTLGPAVNDASLELLKARIIHGTYPPGYTPKRDTKIMVRLPLTEEEVETIHAFLSHTP